MRGGVVRSGAWYYRLQCRKHVLTHCLAPSVRADSLPRGWGRRASAARCNGVARALAEVHPRATGVVAQQRCHYSVAYDRLHNCIRRSNAFRHRCTETAVLKTAPQVYMRVTAPLTRIQTLLLFREPILQRQVQLLVWGGPSSIAAISNTLTESKLRESPDHAIYAFMLEF